MPANLPPVYHEIERKLRFAQSPEEKILIINEMIAIMPKHKGTDKLLADLRRKISQLKKEIGKKPHAQRADLYTVMKEGAGQVVLIGSPNSGKSTILATLTNAKPLIGNFPFTTGKPEVVMMEFENVQIQLVDTPPLAEEHNPPWLLALARASNALLITIPCTQDPIKELRLMLGLLENGNVFVTGKDYKFEAKELMQKYGIVILTKDCSHDAVSLIEREFPRRFELFIIDLNGENRELRRKIFEYIDVIRVYTKPPGKEADFSEPVILKKGSTVIDAAYTLHKDFAEKLKYARLWRDKINGMMTKRDLVLQDGDIIEFHIIK